MATSTVLSDTLQSITATKIHELEKQKDSYNARKANIRAELANHPDDVRARLDLLIDRVRETADGSDGEIRAHLHNFQLWHDQSEFDPSVSKAKLLASEQYLLEYLEQGSRKLDLAHLYSRLLTEWVQSPNQPESMSDDVEGSGSDDSFEVMPDSQKARLEQLRDKFARVVFEPLETDEQEITNYLNGLFQGDREADKLKEMRHRVAANGERMLGPDFRFSDQDLKWCIQGLLHNSLLNDEKKASLNDFLKDEAVLGEIQDVLNMRLRDLKDWEWNLGDEGMTVVPRQSLNGKWRIMMDEDVLQALLTHWIGTYWAVQLKTVLVSSRYSARLWKQYTRLPDREMAKRQYFLSSHAVQQMHSEKNIARERHRVYDQHFFMSSLPSKLYEDAGGYYDEDTSVDDGRLSPKDIKQLMLRNLTTEVLVRRSLGGEVAVVQSDFQWFATGIAHSTVFAVMRFIGFQEEWITFFRKVMEPPLNILDGSPVRTRKRGLPMAHIFEKMLGELVLYFMDLAVAQNNGTILYRFHDDLWLVGPPKACADSWQTMEKFAKVMGLEFNFNKTGSVYLTDGKTSKSSDVVKALPEGPVEMNFLVMDPDSGKWTINDEHVQEHVQQLQKQLNQSTSVLQWIKTWNSCIGRFFSYTFGEPAHCFGEEHVDKTMQTHTDMQKYLFNSSETGKTVGQHVNSMLKQRFEVEDVPESFIFLPESLGGLGLKNPFLPLLLLRADVCLDPDARMQKFHKDEREAYNEAKKTFESLNDKERRKRYKTAFKDYEDGDTAPPLSWSEAQSFMTFEDFTKYRALDSKILYDTYTFLLSKPEAEGIRVTAGLRQAVEALKKKPDELEFTGKTGEFDVLWTVKYFEEELTERFGGVEVVDKRLLPMGVLKALRERKVTWQMVL